MSRGKLDRLIHIRKSIIYREDIGPESPSQLVLKDCLVHPPRSDVVPERFQ